MTNLFDLTGSRAIVTGGTRGLGHGMAEGLFLPGREGESRQRGGAQGRL